MKKYHRFKKNKKDLRVCESKSQLREKAKLQLMPVVFNCAGEHQNHFHYWFWDLGCDPSLILTEHATLTYLSFLEYSLDNHKTKELDKESHFLEQTYTVSTIKNI